MRVPIEELRRYLQAFDFPKLFAEGLGWNYYQGEPLAIPVDGYEYALTPVAEKAQFAVFECAPGSDGAIPVYPLRRKIETQVTKRAFEHLIIFVDAARTQQIWQWVKREPGKPTACREHRFDAGQTGQPLLQRLDSFIFTLEDEAKGIGISDVTASVAKGFDVERVTKRFYERFRTELAAFGEFIQGISEIGAGTEQRDWYASLMLNRMMFVYFIQKQGFLDGDRDYLRNKLQAVQALPESPPPALNSVPAGPDPQSVRAEPSKVRPDEPASHSVRAELVEARDGGRFHRFYRLFLLRLFHEGLGQPAAQRAPELAALLGKVPFLNGGLFDVHDLERDNPHISIPDAAFARVFDFFDGYRWHLDERPYREDNEINPDVLGYIFEKYVNQKQMGAYYTKEDITGYISRNTVIPFLFDAAKWACPVAFGPEGGVWRLLRDDPDRYIYPAVGHGIAWNARQPADPKRLDAPCDLPADIAAGIDDVSQRAGWNQPAPDQFALPTETWREVVARRQRYAAVRAILANGDVTEINHCITLNLDIEKFARDVIAQSEGPELLRAFWHALYGNSDRSRAGVSVLDPTCGSGAFLFAALNVLEPLYTACLEGMRGFLDDAARSERKRGPAHLSDFREALAQMAAHPSPRYFILKSIVLNNLYGVDIMEEAVEICKLRLFLKLVAQLDDPDQIEPLPDVDFNVRAGNTLVGFTSRAAVRDAMTATPDGQRRMVSAEDNRALSRIDEQAENASAAFNRFRWQQTLGGGEVTAADKQALRDRLRQLDDELNRLLAAQYGIDPHQTAAYHAWRASHQPFHWFTEFHGIMSKGGFDVVIGNPPYLEFRQVDYTTLGYVSHGSSAIHALCIERCVTLLNTQGCMSMIVPLALPSTQRMKIVQDLLEKGHRNVWYANFAWRPAKLFDTVNRALTIFTVAPSKRPQTLSTAYQKWTSDCREDLFDRMRFARVPRDRPSFWVPKLGTTLERTVLDKLVSVPTSVADFVGRTEHRIFYRTTGGLYWKVFTDFAPSFVVEGRAGSSSRETSFSVRRASQVRPLVASLSSDIFWWWYTVTSNLRDTNPADIRGFPIPKSVFSDPILQTLGKRYIEDIVKNSTMLVRQQKQTGRTETQSFEIRKSKPIIDEIDGALASHYGFTDEELDFIVNYDIKYRLGR